MYLIAKRLFPLFVVLLSAALLPLQPMQAQQTLGGITGTVVDPSGSEIPDVSVQATSEDTGLERKAKSNAQGTYAFNDLPIGKYTITFTRDGFSTERYPGILVQADRTVSLPAQLKVGTVADSVEVDVNPLLNAVDTTNGYILDRAQIESIPLPTGSFTGVAILSPGVNAELPGGTGVNAGLGNAPIWANGERDTSNSFLLNGVDGSNLFNGKSTSQVASSRVTPSTGVGNTGGGGVIQSSASVYLSIGNALPSPAPETIQEVRVNASMYDAQQGATSGAHIDLSTTSGTNNYHGNLYLHRGTNWLNAAPFFFKQDQAVPADDKNPQLHRYVLGGTFGGPIIKDKLFGFLAYQHVHVSDAEIGDGFLDVPVGLTDDRSPQTLTAIANQSFGDGSVSGAIDPVALALFNAPAVKGEQGKWLIPNAQNITLDPAHTFNAFIPGTAYFTGDQAVGNIDYNATAKDTLALKYYYQHDPLVAPYAYSNVPGFTQKMDAGAQVFSINNTYLVKSNLSTNETFGFLREKLYNNNDQAFGPGNIPGGSYPSASIDTFGSNYFPGVSIIHTLG
ncbi:MAG: carboxypeptidase-like regulatory domain-containing protein, partial [Acidobacteriaceae bacterium]